MLMRREFQAILRTISFQNPDFKAQTTITRTYYEDHN